jgi:hypothetical protein
MPISIIGDSTNNDILFNPTINGNKMGHGYDQEQADRDLAQTPRRSLAHLFGDAPNQIKIIPESEWDARFEEQEAQQSSLEHIRMRGDHGKMISALDQNGQGFCWAYSTTGAVMMLRASANLPHVRLSGHAIGCQIKNYRDEGGWGALSADWVMKNGVPSVQFWKEKSMSRNNDTPEMRANALEHLVSEDWSDQSASPYDRNLTTEQLATLLFNDIPVIADFNWWSHSVLLLRWMRISKGNWGPKLLNSWTNGWEDHGMSTLEGSKGRPDGAVALRVSGATNN